MHLSPVRDVQDHCEQSGSPQVIAYTDIMAVKKADGTESNSPISEMAKKTTDMAKLVYSRHNRVLFGEYSRRCRYVRAILQLFI